MNKTFILFLLSLIICFHAFSEGRVSQQIIVKFKNQASFAQEIKKINESSPAFQLAIIRQLSKSWNAYLLKVSGDEHYALNVLKKYGSIEIAQFNHYVSSRSIIPNDPEFPIQWNLHNTGQSQGLPDADIDAPEAWQLATGNVSALGDTLVVAVIDEGMDLNHQDIRYWKNRNEIPGNGIDDDQNGYIDDYDGWDAGSHSGTIPNNFHGTEVTGIISAKGNDSIGIAGIAWDARIMPVSVSQHTEAEVVEAYSYVFDMRKLYNQTAGAEGAFVVSTNSSFGIDLGKPEDYPFWTAMYDLMGSVGILSIGATANRTLDIDVAGDIPSSCPNDHLIIATSTNRYDQLSPGTAFGLTTVDLAAPGQGIRTTIPNNGYLFASGTSMAAPHVAGAVAFLYSVACADFMQAYKLKPDSMSLIIKEYLLSGVDILPGLDGRTVAGGRMNLFNSAHSLYNDFCVNCLEISASVNPVLCYGDSMGNISLNIQNGVPPYSYQWSNGDSLSVLNGVSRGKYWVKVNDANSCEKYQYFEIIQPTDMLINFYADSSTDGQGGYVKAFVKGGVQPYTYLWDDPAHSITEEVAGLTPGQYSITVTDKNGCELIDSVIVFNRVTGIRSFPEFELTLYPNPAKEFVSYSIAGFSTVNLQFIIKNSLGQSLWKEHISQNSGLLELSDLHSGIYFIEVVADGKKVVTQKIILL